MEQEIHIADVYGRIRKAIDAAGGQKFYAAKLGVSPSYINLVVNGVKPPSDRVLSAIGIKRQVMFVAVVPHG